MCACGLFFKKSVPQPTFVAALDGADPPSTTTHFPPRFLLLRRASPRSRLRIEIRLHMTSSPAPTGPVSVEITVVSAQGLKNPTLNALFSRRLKAFATLSAVSSKSTKGQVHTTSVDRRGGSNPTWNEKFRLAVDPAFFADLRSSVYLTVHARRLAGGQALLGWCQIPAGDILSPAAPAGSVVFLSYRLRDRDGTRGHGTVDVSARVVVEQGWVGSRATRAGCGDAWPTVIGLPVASACG
ncbi:hypothetical protein BT93_D1765 [Corymbia citriodora subsp. variegata]|nr:hypothetical protein BT93_D1765 [Corymbia citriodora subsp. variegata]